jgi:hypothetical protein
MAKQDDWMEKLVKNYNLPEQKEKETPKRMLTEAQKKIISTKK